jgi:hypothetical protein
MVLTVIAEGRSGGQTLTEWFRLSLKNKFIIAHEPYNPDNNDFTKDVNYKDTSWIDPNKSYFIKELWRNNVDFSTLLDISDVVMCLYRENWYEQSRSYLFAEKTNLWHHRYNGDMVKKIITEEEIISYYGTSLKNNKEEFKNWIDLKKIPSISYENLYFSNGINFVKNTFKLNSEVEFPIGSKYYTEGQSLI